MQGEYLLVLIYGVDIQSGDFFRSGRMKHGFLWLSVIHFIVKQHTVIVAGLLFVYLLLLPKLFLLF